MVRLIRSSTRAAPRSVANATLRSLTESSSLIAVPDGAAGGGAPDARIQHVAQSVAEEVEAHHGQEDGEAWGQRIPPGVGQEFARLRDRAPPLGRGRRRPEAEEAERGR